jgi:uncharacterized protein DUF4838
VSRDSERIRFRSIILTIQDLTADRWVPLLAEANLNTLILHAVHLPQDITNLINYRNSDAGRALYQACHARGIEIEYQMHTASWLVPRSYFGKTPEMFRMDIRGQRTCDHNFCLSSDAAWDLFTTRARKLAAALPSGTGRFFFFGDDVPKSSACHCPQCARFSASDQGLIYARRMVAAIRKDQPEARVSMLAYGDSLSTPETGHLDDGLFLEYAPIGRCYRHALDDPECAINRSHVAALKSLLAFSGHLPFHVTEYWLDASLFSKWRRPAVKIPVSMDIVRRDVAFYHQLGAESIATYAVMCDGEYWDRFGAPPVVEYGAALRDCEELPDSTA